MATFVLVHGAWHGGWCWEKMTPLLEKAGHKVVTPDMPGHGNNRNVSPDQVTLKGVAESIDAVLDKQSEPVILAGHSMGGVVVSQAAEYRPEKIKKLVYVCAFLLGDGQTLQTKGGGRHRPQTENDFKELFYHDCPAETWDWAKSRLAPPALSIASTPIHITENNYGRIPRYYIECLNDRAIPIEKQRQMYTEMPCQKVFTMNTGHFPMLANPEELARILLSLV
jgi:pimeloyl-ACP methyl ester carboxylesterase